MQSNGIKNLKPNPHSKWGKQGYFDVSESHKYMGSLPCIFRSNLELRFFQLFETNDKYLKWDSEPSSVKIMYEFGGKLRRYNVDVAFIQSDNTKWIAEIKPFYQTQPPKNRNSIKFKQSLEVFEQNIAKWRAAKQWAEENDYNFCILTENFLK